MVGPGFAGRVADGAVFVAVGTGSPVGIGEPVAVGELVDVGELVGGMIWPVPKQGAVPESVNVLPGSGTNCQS